ncbi:prokaryotic molybdopterin-containing oxidoreductase family, membrane subunit [Allochromatium warmingii]|uniref:Prokaryotic molybdopterin-containing oxidoreductase family, membrane subunit n=1 Tax=Allochromatium warmingii TaxID=61595 RepID=A0A1H3DPX0_ALLWA|nr:NrfD/PsrC family molybdoenzyme membrane anchor subunit [Allochromatium warmingii]SDX68455.1 prokaryotic molybdopterin-containing oxidoreductase family, membrane subunit [Allochromatium warmingii]
MKRVVYREWRIAPERYWSLLGFLAALIGVAALSFGYMEHEGHWVSGMNNSVVWGMPHVFAVFLIVAASGALNIASIGSVFKKPIYKPLGRLSGLLAVAMLMGGLLVLVMDLGRPERLIVAMTSYNFSSIFAWNIFLYTGFMVIVIAYLWSMADRKGGPFNYSIGLFALVWRLALTTGTGSIFGFLVARQAYDAAILGPMFVALSFAYGLAVFMLVLLFSFDEEGRPIGPRLMRRLRNLLALFIGVALYFTLVYHLTNLYIAENDSLEHWLLLSGGIYTFLFWVGWILAGSLIPMWILYHPVLSQQRDWIIGACALVIVGGFAAMYVIIIGSQAFPMALFPGHTIIESGFADGVNGAAAAYWPTIPEILLGLGGVAMALLITAVGVRVLQFLPESLADDVVAPDEETLDAPPFAKPA